MSLTNYKGEIERNLQEQVYANMKNDIALAKEIQALKTLVGFDIKVIGVQETWEEPSGSYNFGDTILVGPEGGPYNFYIYTRYSANAENGYWLNYGPISVVGPEGPEGPVGPQGPKGESTKWYAGDGVPTGEIVVGDMWLQSSTGAVYRYENGSWVYKASIKGNVGNTGPMGPVGPTGPMGPMGPAGPRGYTTITNIIGTLPEGSIISDTYNPATQEANATVLMPVSGVQHAWVVIDGSWRDVGPYSGGSSVYSGGQFVQTFDADTKLDKLTGTGDLRVYARDAAGRQTNRQIGTTSQSIEGGVIPQYFGATTTVGSDIIRNKLLCGDPTLPYHTANKKYVDEQIAAAHSELQHAKLSWSRMLPAEFTVDLGVYVDTSNNTLPDVFGVSGNAGWTLTQYGYSSIGHAYTNLEISMDDNEMTLFITYGSTGTPTTLTTFTIDSYTLAGTVATFYLIPAQQGPDGGIFIFDCVPSL